MVAGADTGKPCVTVLVTRKGESTEPVPTEVDGVVTDVIEDNPEWCAHTWPCMCGDEIGTARSGHKGTLGLVYYLDSQLYGMTCAHVMAGAEVGTGVTHPGGIGRWYMDDDGIKRNHADIGVLAKVVLPESGVDAAAIAIDPGGDPEYPQFGHGCPWSNIRRSLDVANTYYERADTDKRPIASFPVYSARLDNRFRHPMGHGNWTSGIRVAQQNAYVEFYANRTPYGKGDVFSTDATVMTTYGRTRVVMRDMIVVRVAAQQGDSGALIRDLRGYGLAMITMAARWAYCQPLQRCLTALHGDMSKYDIW